MKRCRDMVVTSPVLGTHALARYVEAFADRSGNWKFHAQKSPLYEQMCGKPSCCIVTASIALPLAAVHMTEKSEHSLFTTNIIPLDRQQLSADEYNAIALAFARDIRTDAQRNATHISVKMSKAELHLADIVTGKLSRKLLNRYLNLFPLSHHPADIGRLDAFICSMFRYKRRPFDLDGFEALLAEERGWSSADARWCRNRVEFGLEVLAANRQFHGE